MQGAYPCLRRNMPFYGFAVMCIDHPVVQRDGRGLQIEDGRRLLTYGENPQADFRLLDI
jgi:UDP-N-acetylmuramate--alanine ligase